MATKKLPDPNWKDQLYAYGFSDEDIDAMNVVPQHRFFIQLNDAYAKTLSSDLKALLEENSIKMIKDVHEVIQQELRPVKEDIKALNSKVGMMQSNYHTMSETIAKLDKRTEPWKVWAIRIVMFFAAVVVGAIVFYFLFPWVHNRYVLKGLLSMIWS